MCHLLCTAHWRLFKEICLVVLFSSLISWIQDKQQFNCESWKINSTTTLLYLERLLLHYLLIKPFDSAVALVFDTQQQNYSVCNYQPLDTHHSNDRNKHTKIPCTTGGLEKKREVIINISTKAFLNYLVGNISSIKNSYCLQMDAISSMPGLLNRHLC